MKVQRVPIYLGIQHASIFYVYPSVQNTMNVQQDAFRPQVGLTPRHGFKEVRYNKFKCVP